MTPFNNYSLHHNTFILNNVSLASQAYEGYGNNTNKWYDPETNEGNYWADYSGSGAYVIDGDTKAYDPYPLDEEGNPIPQPPDFDQEEDGMPNSYEYLMGFHPLVDDGSKDFDGEYSIPVMVF